MKAVASAAAALLVSRVAGADVSEVEPRTEVTIETPLCAVDADGQLLQDCCMSLSSDDVDCGAGYVRIVTYAETGCQFRMATVCTRLGLEDLNRCGEIGLTAIPDTCEKASQALRDSGVVKGAEGTCFSDESNMFGMEYSCTEASAANSGEDDDAEVVVPPTPSPFFVDTLAPTAFPTVEIGGSGAGPTPSPFFVDTWAPTRFPTIEEGGSGFGPTMAVSSPPTLMPSYSPTPSPEIPTDTPTVSPTVDDSEENKEGESDDVSGSRMLAASLKISAAVLAVFIALQ